jgi:competence protein ComEA
MQLVRPTSPFDVMERAMIDLNDATAEELDAIAELKGHGFEIVRYRKERGRFDALRQLDEVPGLAGKWDGAETKVRVC